MTPVMQSFMSAVALLRSEMEACQDEVAALAEQGVNAWIDADWAASFFELAFAPGSIPPPLAGVEVIACKIYLHAGAGVILHVVYFAGSLYCVLADSVEDLPLLDVAFPDVTARNRVVQVRTYDDKAGRRLAAAHAIRAAPPAGAGSGSEKEKNSKDVDTGLCPVPVSLRVWEGRRKGIPGVGYGAALALADDKAGAAAAIREKARLRAEAEAAAAAIREKARLRPEPAANAAGQASLRAEAGVTAAAIREKGAATSVPVAASDSKADAEPASAAAAAGGAAAEGKEPDGGAAGGPLGRMSGLVAALPARSAGVASDGKAGEAGAAAGAGEADEAAWRSGAGGMSRDPTLRNRGAAAIPSALLNSVARGPHHLAPLKRPDAAASAAAGGAGAAADAGNALDAARNRLLVPAGAFGGEAEESKMADAPWDASGRPRGR